MKKLGKRAAAAASVKVKIEKGKRRFQCEE
jgi:hypothetical protein